MEASERSLLLARDFNTNPRNNFNEGLSAVFAAVCIVDVFGVFPIVALPKAIIQCGYYGIAVVLLVTTIQIYTAVLLGKCWLLAEEMYPAIQSKNRYPYSAITEFAYGKTLSKFVTILLDVTVFVGGIPNLLVASQNLQLLGVRLTDNEFNFSYCYWMVLLGAVICPFLWLGSPKDMKLLCTLSVFLVATVFVLVFGSVVFDTRNIVPTYSSSAPLWNSVLTAYGILAFQFDIHPTILTIQVDMVDKRQIHKAIIGAFGISIGIFSLVCIAAAVRYGMSTHWALLDTLPSSSFLHMAAFLIAVQLSLTSAIGNSALYQHLEDFLGIERHFNAKRCLIRTVLTVLAILLAQSVPRFDLVMSMIGGSLTGPIVFVLPPMIYVRMLSLKREHEKRIKMEAIINIELTGESDTLVKEVALDENTAKFSFRKQCVRCITSNRTQRILCFLTATFGICSLISTTYVNVINTVQYANFSHPCIYNLSFYI